jgi:hypothetical protein
LGIEVRFDLLGQLQPGLVLRVGVGVHEDRCGGGIISSKTTRGTTTDSIPVYEVCLQSGEKSGYALVSADSRSAGVLAYIENGNFEKKDSTGACLMLKLAEASTVSEINKIERLKVELREKTLKKVASCLGKQ